MVSRVQPGWSTRVLTMVRSFKTNPRPSEADLVKLLSSVYENARTPEEAASAFAAESTATENAFRLSFLDAAQIRRNYCESPSGAGDAPHGLVRHS